MVCTEAAESIACIDENDELAYFLLECMKPDQIFSEKNRQPFHTAHYITLWVHQGRGKDTGSFEEPKYSPWNPIRVGSRLFSGIQRH